MGQNSCEKSNYRKLIGKSYLITLRLSQQSQPQNHQNSNQEKNEGGEEKRIREGDQRDYSIDLRYFN